MKYGINNNQPHLGGYILKGDPDKGDLRTWNSEVWDKIIGDLNIKSVVDIGCGLGYSTRYFQSKELLVTGIEGDENAISRSVFEGDLRKHDYNTGSCLVEKDSYDLAWCCEFVEHVEEKYVQNFLEDFKRCRHVAMTYGRPGQGGYHHVNCQPQEYWIDKLKNIGFNFNVDYSMELRSISRKTHLKKLLFFTHPWRKISKT